MLLALNKPFDVLSQFTREEEYHRTLAEFDLPPRVYPIGRLDRDSEGLLLLSDDPIWNSRLLQPGREHPREYFAQVEGHTTSEGLEELRRGVLIQKKRTRPCKVRRIKDDRELAWLWPREPPIRYRKNVPDSWLALELTEGRNRQVRRMTAAIGCPTLRLIRVRIGQFRLENLPPGQWRELTKDDRAALLKH